MGRNFMLGVVGVTIGLGVAGFLLFIFISASWARWGFLGTFLLLAAVTLIGGWLMDRRNSRIPTDDGTW